MHDEFSTQVGSSNLPEIICTAKSIYFIEIVISYTENAIENFA